VAVSASFQNPGASVCRSSSSSRSFLAAKSKMLLEGEQANFQINKFLFGYCRTDFNSHSSYLNTLILCYLLCFSMPIQRMSLQSTKSGYSISFSTLQNIFLFFSRKYSVSRYLSRLISRLPGLGQRTIHDHRLLTPAVSPPRRPMARQRGANR
jgi:hypothetical protein